MRKGILAGVVATFLSQTGAQAQTTPPTLPPTVSSSAATILADLPPPSGPPLPIQVDGPAMGSTSPASAQIQQPETLPTPTPAYVPPAPPPSRPTVIVPNDPIFEPSVVPSRGFSLRSPDDPTRAWATADFLLWWIKGGPSPNPLVTSGLVNDALAGALGQPGTSVLFGQQNINYGSIPGGRFYLGVWLPQAPVIGVEAGFFGLGQGRVNFSAFSDANGDQIIARPIFDAQTGTETTYQDSYPGYASGGVVVTSTTEMDSWEINMAINVLQARTWELDLLVGFRALDLVEDLQISETFVPLQAGVYSFLGGPADPPSTIADFDCFRTSNHFYGGQVGGRFSWNTGLVELTMYSKVALGATQQVVDISGASTLYSPGLPPATAPGGVLAQPSNIGRTYHSQFSVVPEAGLNLGFRLTPWMRCTLGYTFLYWSDVVRPGDQIDRTVNSSQVPTSGNYGMVSGPIQPLLTPQTTNFWAQGINFGLEFRF